MAAMLSARRLSANLMRPRQLVATPISSVRAPRPKTLGSRLPLATRAAAGDFDTVLADIADKFEKSENKPVVIGYAAAAAGAVVFSEWLMHLPVLNFLLGGPVQLLGLVMVPYLCVRYLVDNESITQDVGDATAKVTKLLPGLEEKK